MIRYAVGLVAASLAAGCDQFTPPPPPAVATGPAPETTLSGGPRARTRLTTATFQLQSGEVATFQCSLDGAAFAPCTSPATFSGLSVGGHLFRAYAMLSDGRFDATPASHAWEVIATPVETSIQSAPQPITSSTSALFAFSSPEPDATFECSVDGADFASCTSPVNLQDLAAGAHRFRVRAVDADGIRDETPAEVTWTIDAEPPAVEILQAPPAPPAILNDPQFTFVFRATDERARLLCKLDDAGWAPCRSPHTVWGLMPGAHQFSVLAEDVAGNRSAPATAGFMVLWRLGVGCRADSDCESTRCRDGVCCDSPCDGVCRSCALTRGTCTTVRNAVDLDSCSGTMMCDDNGACGPRSTGPLLDGFEFSTSLYRFRGNFPAGRVEMQSGQFRFQGRVGGSR